MQTNEYDVNVYVLNKIFSLYAYTMAVNEDGIFVETDTDLNPVILSIPLETEQQHLQDLISFVLDSSNYASEDWEGHDDWMESAYLVKGAPSSLTSWIDGLPMYQARELTNMGML